MKKLSNHFYFGLALLISLLGSCIPEPLPSKGDGTINLKYRAVYDSMVVIMGDESQEFIHFGDTIYFNEFRFFISNVVLEAENTRDFTFVIPDDNVALFDLSNLDEPETAEIGETFPYTVQPGNYKGIRIDYGIPAELNVSSFDPDLFGGDHPLNDIKNHWADINSYKFMELKGQIKNGNGFHYIIGQDRFYMQNEFYEKNIELTDQSGDISYDFKIDLKDVLGDIRVSDNTRVLREEDLFPLGQELINNFVFRGIKLEKD